MIIMMGFGVSFLIFLALFGFFLKKNTSTKKMARTTRSRPVNNKAFTISSKDIENIAGDNIITTQLDLARAYLETGRKSLAKNILNSVALRGTTEQKQEAEKLLYALSQPQES